MKKIALFALGALFAISSGIAAAGNFGDSGNNEIAKEKIEEIKKHEEDFFNKVEKKVKEETKLDLKDYKKVKMEDVFNSEEESDTLLAQAIFENVIKGSTRGDLKPLIFLGDDKAIVIEKTVKGSNNVYEFSYSEGEWVKESESNTEGEKMKMEPLK
ncbi:MAG TPA: hypothetical protein VNM69_22505 [Bacillus sp. (in: firmicutes)]|uniref:hypothetical protein n=1 Tax=Bacillus litorisediminis TaxID=2922713 RepID=UPI001FAF5102|nr:hypothetical protein [Bacillus litorisediminis]HWO78643.1 hypothetical protein [Bacillus sp. (in: firmicutes)]